MLPDGCPVESPWGRVQDGRKIAAGIYSVSTVSHGGIKLEPYRNALIPDAFRREHGWYEEDCDWAIPTWFLSSLFTGKQIQAAYKTLRAYHWREWEAFSGEIVDPAESFDKREFLAGVEKGKATIGQFVALLTQQPTDENSDEKF